MSHLILGKFALEHLYYSTLPKSNDGKVGPILATSHVFFRYSEGIFGEMEGSVEFALLGMGAWTAWAANIPGEALSTTVAGWHSTDVPGHGESENPDGGRGERYPWG